MDVEWKAREERQRRECEERERSFQQTLAKARQQASEFRQISDEYDNASKRDDMRAAYHQQAEFDPCQIQAHPGHTRNFQAITGHSPPQFDAVFSRPPAHQFPGRQTVGTRTMIPTRRTASEVLQTSYSPHRSRSPPRARTPSPCSPGHHGHHGHHGGASHHMQHHMVMTPPVGQGIGPAPHVTRAGQHGNLPHHVPFPEDMDLTPTVTRGAASQPDMCSPVSEHQALLERVRKTLAMAGRSLNINTDSGSGGTSAPHHTRAQPHNVCLPPGATPHVTRAGQHGNLPPYFPPHVTRAGQHGNLPHHFPYPTEELGLPPPWRPSPTESAAGASNWHHVPPYSETRHGVTGPPPTRSSPPHGSPGPCRTRSKSPRPTQASVQAAIAAGTLKGTQAEMEAMGFRGQRDPHAGEMDPEWNFAQENIQPHEGPAPQCEMEHTGDTVGILKDPNAEHPGEAGAERKFRVLMKRKVVRVVIPPNPDPEAGVMPDHPLLNVFNYEPGDPPYRKGEIDLLPPRRLTPSPPGTSYQEGHPRTTQQMQARRDLEADWERREVAVPTRALPGDRRPANKPLPKSYTTGKPKKHKYYRGGAQANEPPLPTPSTSFGMAMGGMGRPQTPTTRTGLVLRQPTTPTTTRSGSAPPPRRCIRPPTTHSSPGRTQSRPPGRGRSSPPDPIRGAGPHRTRAASPFQNLIHDSYDTAQGLVSNTLDAARELNRSAGIHTGRVIDYAQDVYNRTGLADANKVIYGDAQHVSGELHGLGSGAMNQAGNILGHGTHDVSDATHHMYGDLQNLGSGAIGITGKILGHTGHDISGVAQHISGDTHDLGSGAMDDAGNILGHATHDISGATHQIYGLGSNVVSGASNILGNWLHPGTAGGSHDLPVEQPHKAGGLRQQIEDGAHGAYSKAHQGLENVIHGGLHDLPHQQQGNVIHGGPHDLPHQQQGNVIHGGPHNLPHQQQGNVVPGGPHDLPHQQPHKARGLLQRIKDDAQDAYSKARQGLKNYMHSGSHDFSIDEPHEGFLDDQIEDYAHDAYDTAQHEEHRGGAPHATRAAPHVTRGAPPGVCLPGYQNFPAPHATRAAPHATRSQPPGGYLERLEDYAHDAYDNARNRVDNLIHGGSHDLPVQQPSEGYLERLEDYAHDAYDNARNRVDNLIHGGSHDLPVQQPPEGYLQRLEDYAHDAYDKVRQEVHIDGAPHATRAAPHVTRATPHDKCLPGHLDFPAPHATRAAPHLTRSVPSKLADQGTEIENAIVKVGESIRNGLLNATHNVVNTAMEQLKDAVQAVEDEYHHFR